MSAQPIRMTVMCVMQHVAWITGMNARAATNCFALKTLKVVPIVANSHARNTGSSAMTEHGCVRNASQGSAPNAVARCAMTARDLTTRIPGASNYSLYRNHPKACMAGLECLKCGKPSKVLYGCKICNELFCPTHIEYCTACHRVTCTNDISSVDKEDVLCKTCFTERLTWR